ncbi:DUF2059 domain-containing protein [Pseudomonas syringae]|nr:DUF2059 domain-containing protein [Pseudomonas syringae]MBD8574628.1 DUF2059 domain-containing protein [Pseudomonas syringae]MBD8789190.1 DUF2059 domain-containing protein [Pseudomonas syringae]MBD8800366.1 DUF2059 domain-containing protein [Pseudomonas syringae]MBD8810618.1 DUF2059 domain-containing protein [Pseudomonas syringae]
MTRFRATFAVLVLACASGQVFADTASHNASAETLLNLTNADKLATPMYAQAQQLFAQRFAEAKAPAAKKALLETYQAKANTALDQAIGWNKLKPDMVRIYTNNFTEAELKELVSFYQSPLGKKVLSKMPELAQQSVMLIQTKSQSAVPVVNKLLTDMSAELEPGKAQAPATKTP